MLLFFKLASNYYFFVKTISFVSFQRLWPAIVTTLEEQLGENFDNKVGLAWERVFQYIGGKVIEGIKRWKKKK
jgi:hypothetical protein